MFDSSAPVSTPVVDGMRAAGGIAIDAACTHMYAPGVRRHIRAALDLGVPPEQIVTVLEMVSVLGIHACNVGIPVLAEELEAFAGRSAGSDG